MGENSSPQDSQAAEKGGTPPALFLSWQGWAVLVVLLLGVLRILFWSQPVGLVERGKTGIILAGFAAAIIYLVISSNPTSAVATGRLNLGLFRLRYRAFGPGAMFLIVLAAFMHFTGEAYQTLDVRLFNPDDTLLEKNFKASWHTPDTGRQSGEFQSGNASLRGLPVGLDELDVTIVCPGYKPKDKPPYPIQNRTVRIVMIPEVIPPLPSTRFPHVEADLIPDKKTVAEKPRVSPDLVTFHYHNQTGEDLTLLGYDCYKHHFPSSSLTGRSLWISFPFHAGPAQLYERFENGSGWFVFFVQDSSGINHFLAKQSIFQSRNPWLIVTKKGDRFVPEFRFEE